MELNKMMEVLDDLINKENIDKVINDILQQINKITEKILDVAEKNKVYDFQHGSIRVFRTQFRFGTGYVTTYVLRVNGRGVPKDADHLGYDYHPYGNFDNYAKYMDLDDIRDFVNDIEDFIQAFKEHVEKHREELLELKEEIAKVSL